MDQSAIIKKVDLELKQFAGVSPQATIDEIFSDPEKYRRLADRFWRDRVATKKAA